MLDNIPSGSEEAEDDHMIPIDMEKMAEELNLKDTISKYAKLGLADPLNRADSIDDAIKLIKN
jgi:hypothetical protein